MIVTATIPPPGSARSTFLGRLLVGDRHCTAPTTLKYPGRMTGVVRFTRPPPDPGAFRNR